jgi:hypothetical protein
MKDMQQGTAREMGGIAMIRRSISAIVASLLIGLSVIINGSAVSADGPCDTDAQGNCAAYEPLVSVASMGPAVAVPTINDRFVETNTTTLPSVGGSDAPPAVCLTDPSPCMISFG